MSENNDHLYGWGLVGQWYKNERLVNLVTQHTSFISIDNFYENSERYQSKLWVDREEQFDFFLQHEFIY